MIHSDGAPKHCWDCGHDKFEQENIRHEEGLGVYEYDVKCERCGSKNGSWAYGNWCA